MEKSIALFLISDIGIKEFRAYSSDKEVNYGVLVMNVIEQWHNYAWDHGATREFILEVLEHFDAVEDEFTVDGTLFTFIPDVPPTSYLIPAPVYGELLPDFGIRI